MDLTINGKKHKIYQPYNSTTVDLSRGISINSDDTATVIDEGLYNNFNNIPNYIHYILVKIGHDDHYIMKSRGHTIRLCKPIGEGDEATVLAFFDDLCIGRTNLKQLIIVNKV